MFVAKTPLASMSAIPVDPQDIESQEETTMDVPELSNEQTKEKPEVVVEQEVAYQVPSYKVITGEWINVGNNLPSKGLAYPPNTKIRYRPYNFDELETVNGSDLTVFEQYSLILEGIDVTGMPKENLTLGDFLYTMLMRKVTSLGTEFITVNYSISGVAHTHDINVFSINYSEIDVPKLPIRVKSLALNKDVIFEPLTVGKYLEYLRGDFGVGLKETTAALALSISNMDFESAYKYVSTSTGLDSIHLSKIDKLLYHGLDTILLPMYKEEPNPSYSDDMEEELRRITPKTLKIKKGEVAMDLTDSSLLLLPFRESLDTEDGGIRFG